MNKEGYVKAVESLLHSSLSVGEGRVRPNKLTLEKLAKSFGITDRNLVKELTELAIVQQARKLAHEPGKTIAEKFASIVELYKGQVNLSHRTSQSVLLQQYSTPAPIGYLMGIFCGVDKPGKYLEPSAGNGLLTIAANPEDFYVNEIDPVRRENLSVQGFAKVTAKDATRAVYSDESFAAVITNPPFGRRSDPEEIDGYGIRDLDHVMAIRALDCMANDGSAAIIIGGHTTWDEQGRVTAGKNRIFFNYLHKHYNVVDTILIDGHAPGKSTSLSTIMFSLPSLPKSV